MKNEYVEQQIKNLKKADKTLLKNLNKYLVDTHIKNMEAFLTSYLDAEEMPIFVENIIQAYKKDKKIFVKLARAAGKLTYDMMDSAVDKKNYKVLLIYGLFATRSQKTDIMRTIKMSNSALFENILKKFENVSFFLSSSKYHDYINEKDIIGDYKNYYEHPDNRTQFVTSTKDADDIIKGMQKKETLDEQYEYFERKLGYDAGYFKSHSPMYRIDLDGKKIQENSQNVREALENINMYLPSGAEQGANEFWIPGGYTSGGVPEIVVDGIPNTKTYVKGVYKYENQGGCIAQKNVTSKHKFSKKY